MAFAALWLCMGNNQIFEDPYSTVVESKDGRLLGAHIAADEQWRFPMIDSVPQSFIDALLTYEDKRYYNHFGVDPIAIGRALVGNIRAGKVLSGASTLTMQTIRLSRKGKSRSLWQKVVEAILAVRLEIASDKHEILKMYATHAPFGGNVVGLETASWRYFDKSHLQLSIAESAMLAVLPNAPSLIHISRNRKQLKNKRDELLLTMLTMGKVDTMTYELAVLEDIPPRPYPLPRLAPHLLAHLTVQHPEQARFCTTINYKLQQMTTDIVDFHHEAYAQSAIHNMGVLVLDTWSGEVLSYVGNTPRTSQESAVDMVQAPRSSGSILKPFLYAHMINEGLLTPQMLVPDVPTQIAGFRPRNYDRTYRGAVPAKSALALSLNVPAVTMLQDYNVARFVDRLQTLGLKTINKTADHYGLSLILGGGEVTLWQLAGAYASLGRIVSRFGKDMSKYSSKDVMPPTLFKRKVSDSDLYRSPMLSAGAIHHTFEAMEEVKRPDQEGSWRSFNSSNKIAWKTGTSYGHRDAWAVGITERYTVAVWVGNADGEGVHSLVGVQKAAPVLFDIFNRLPNDKYFDQPIDDLEPLAVCKQTGHLAGPYCEQVDTVSLASTLTESEACPYHQIIHLDEKGLRVHRGCTHDKVTAEKRFVLPPVMEYFYKRLHPSYKPLPVYSTDCEAKEDHSPLAFIYPDHQATIYVPVDLDGSREKIIAQATHKEAGKKMYWHIDEHYLGTTEEVHSIDLQVDAGTHVLTIVDEAGHRAKQEFTVIGE